MTDDGRPAGGLDDARGNGSPVRPWSPRRSFHGPRRKRAQDASPAAGPTLAATGCTPLMDPHADGVILFDIGGGSSELVRLDRSPPGDRGPPEPRIKAWASLPVGVVTLAERHGGHVVTPEIYAAMIAEVA